MKRVLTLFFISALFVYGCASSGKQTFEQGQELAKVNRIEEALSLYEDAVRQEPDNQEYKDTLKQARELLVKKYLDKARSFTDARPLTFDILRNAQNMVDKASKISPDNEDAAKLSAGIKSEMDALTKKAELLYSSATKAIETNDWVAAIEKLREIKTFYPAYLDLPVKLTLAENSSVEYYLKEAEKLKAAEDWGGVIRVLALAREIQPNNAELEARAKEAQEKHKPEHYLSMADDAAKNNDWENVMNFINKVKVFPLNGETIRKTEQLKLQASAFFMNKAEENFSGKHLYPAYVNLQSALNLRPEIRKDQKTAEFIEQMINAMIAVAEPYESGGQLGNAFVWYEKALKLSSGRREILAKTQSLKDIIKQKVVKKIAIMDFTSPSNSPDAGRIMTDSLLSYLTKNSSGDVKILARDVLGALLKEIELGQAGLYDIESAKKAGKLKGTDVFIFGSVLQYNVEKNIDEGYKVVSAVVGKKTHPNQAYQNWVSSHPQPDAEELKTAPPQYIDEEIRETIKYKVANHKKTASVNVSFRVIDVEEGEVVITKTLKNKKEAEDTYSEGVDFANIAYKALKLPSDTELFEQVVESSVADLGYEVLSRFQNLQVLYSNSAEILKKKGEFLRAIEKYVDAIHVEEVKNVSSPVSENARKEIEQILISLSI